MSENNKNKNDFEIGNDKYLLPEKSSTIKKLKMFNDDIFIPENIIKEERIQKILDRLNKNKKIDTGNNKTEVFTERNGGVNKSIDKIFGKKKYSNRNVEISSRNEKKKERKDKPYLSIVKDYRANKEKYDIFFVSRLFNYLGYPTFYAYIYDEKIDESNDEESKKGFLIEKIDGSNRVGIETYYENKEIAKQFIKKNIVTTFFADDDATQANTIFNEKTQEVKPIDICVNKPIIRADLLDFLRGSNELSDKVYILNISNSNEEMLEICKDERAEFCAKYNYEKIKRFFDSCLPESENAKFLKQSLIQHSPKLIPEKFNENNKMSNSDYFNLIRIEYLNLQKKLFLIDEKDLAFITFSTTEEFVKNNIDFSTEIKAFIDKITLHQTKSFCWMYNQGNLHKLFDLSKEYEEKLHTIFNIDEFSEKFSEILNTCNFVLRSNYDKKFIDDVLIPLSESQQFKDFKYLTNLFSAKIEKENYKNLDELFSDNKALLENALDNSKNFKEFIEKFSEALNITLDIPVKNNKTELTAVQLDNNEENNEQKSNRDVKIANSNETIEEEKVDNKEVDISDLEKLSISLGESNKKISGINEVNSNKNPLDEIATSNINSLA